MWVLLYIFDSKLINNFKKHRVVDRIDENFLIFSFLFLVVLRTYEIGFKLLFYNLTNSSTLDTMPMNFHPIPSTKFLFQHDLTG